MTSFTLYTHNINTSYCSNISCLPLPLFDLRAGDAGEPGDRGMTSGFVGVVNLRFVSFLAGDSILRVLSFFRGLLSPSGSGLVGFVISSEWGAVQRQRIRHYWVNDKVKCKTTTQMKLNQSVLIPLTVVTQFSVGDVNFQSYIYQASRVESMATRED